MHSEINSVKNYSKYYLIAIGILVVIVMVSNSYFRIKDFQEYQTATAERAVTVTSNGITQLLKERVRQVKLLISDQVEYIRIYSENSKSQFIRDKLADQIENYFPTYVGFVIATNKNKLIIDGLESSIGTICFEKSKANLENDKTNIIMHPDPDEFHFDIASKWGNEKSGGLFIISFKVSDLVNLLKFSQPHLHELNISAINQNEVYMTADGSQDVLKRNINKLTPEELDRIIISLPIELTNWQLVDIHSKSLFSDYYQKSFIQIVFVIILFCGVLFAALKIIHTEEQKRCVIEKKLRDSKDSLISANIELKKVAVTDVVTGISSRRSFDDRIKQEISRGQRNSEPLAVIMADIDNFKLYNDTFRHTKGDESLYLVAQAIKSVLKRPTDFVARYGGEEFVIILVNTQLKGAELIAEEIRKAVLELKIPHSTVDEEFVTLSLGVSVATNSYSEITTKVLVEQADKALYQAKDGGRNQVCIFEQPGDSNVHSII